MLEVFDFLFVTFVILLSTLMWHIKNRRQHPPGPIGFPILGMIPFQIMKIFFPKWFKTNTDAKEFRRLNEKYGPIWSLQFGAQRLINLSSWELINDALIKNGELFSGRPKNIAFTIVATDKGILFADGEGWRIKRNLAMKALKELGMGKRILNEIISDEAKLLISYLRKSSGVNVNLMDALTKGVLNIIIRLVFKERHRYSDDSLKEYINRLRIILRSDVTEKKISLFPKLFQTKLMKKLCPDVGEFIDAYMYHLQYIRTKCAARTKEQKTNAEPECLIDYFFGYKFPDFLSLTEENRIEYIEQTMGDIFGAGLETTSNLLSFCCLLLGRYEALQNNLRNEIRPLCDFNGDIDLDQRKQCVKLLSFIDEVQRFCCLVPKVYRRVMQQCEFHGYKLSPNDIITADFANLFRNPDLFVNPENFNAERFIDESGTKYRPSKYLIPFGVGKRTCLGESIAVVELFIFLTKIINTFKITLTQDTMDNFDNIFLGYSGMVHNPLEHHLNLESL